MKKLNLVLFCFLCLHQLAAQQIPDTTFVFEVAKPLYAKGQGPEVVIDAAHYNFHTAEGRFRPFAQVLEKDGYRVRSNTELFSKKSLKDVKILVIANALNAKNENNWSTPTYSAFTPDEIEALRKWVEDGGSLWLVADHMPFAGASAQLANAFGFQFFDGFAMDNRRRNYEFFFRNTKQLWDNSVTNGRFGTEAIDTVVTFTGQAFKVPGGSTAILTFDRNYTLLMPQTAWDFQESTPFYNVENWCQAAYRKIGLGKVAVFGEAAMLTAQLSGPEKQPTGFNTPVSRQNIQLILNMIHWLDGKLKD